MTDQNTAVVAQKQEHPIVVLRSRLEARSNEIRAAWPGVAPDRIIRAVVTAAQINPDILATTFQSLFLAVMRACRDGLIPDGVEGAIVPYKDRATWIPMYRGLLKKFQQSGQFKWITANVVYEGDSFEHYIDEHGEHIRHTPSDTFDDSKIVRAYAMATTTTGGVFITVMSRAEIDKHRSFSRAKRDDLPWTLHYPEMAKKTTLIRLSKTLPIAPVESGDEDDGYIEETARPQLAALNPNRARGAAAALDAFAGSATEGMAPPDDSSASDATVDERGGGGQSHDGESLTRPEPEGQAVTADATVRPDPENLIGLAYNRGLEAKAKGHQRKALPPEYRTPERDAEAQAWLKAWDEK